MKRFTATLLALAMLVACMLTGCSSNKPANESQQPSASQPGGEETPAPGGETDGNVLSFGLICQFSNGIGLGMYNSLVSWVDHVNKNGGVDIGGTAYTLNMIAYDSDGNADTAQAGVEKLIYEDKVDYIISDTNMVDPWLHTCEENQVVAFAETASSDIYANDWQYVYEVGAKNAMAAAMNSWYFTAHPEAKTVVSIHPDSASGETDGQLFVNIMAALWPDVEVTSIGYPADSTDLSAVATKVVQLDPDVFVPVGGGPNAIGNACKSVRQAGYEGDMFSTSPFAAKLMLNFIDASDAEGFINCALPTEFEEPLTDLAKEFKQAYIDYYGEWDSPEVVSSTSFFALIAALQQAGTTDKDAVREVLNNGMVWETPVGTYKMVARSDYGQTRTCDSISDYYMKTMVNGEATLIDDGYLDVDFVQAAFEVFIGSLEH